MSLLYMPADSGTGERQPARTPRPDLPSAALPVVRPVVVAPTYNNAATLGHMLADLEQLGLPVVVVDDGSTDQTPTLLGDWIDADSVGRTVLTHDRNRGKAAALQTAFRHAEKLCFTHAISLDTDGQLDASDVPQLLASSQVNPAALVLGVRDSAAADYPARSRFGRWFSNALVRFESGTTVADSQCGLRIYPLKTVNQVRCQSGHYGFETEIITRLRWAGTPITEVPVACRYFSTGQRVSHFKPVLDSLRALRMHGRLILTAMNPVHRGARPAWSAPAHSLPRQFLSWINPMSAWRQVRGEHKGHTRFAAGFAAGVFIATLPLYGVQTLVGLFVAKRFKLNPVSVVAGANVSIPPIGPVLIAGAIAVGHVMLHGSLPTLDSYDFRHHSAGDILLPAIIEWVLGGFVLGIVLALLSFVGLNSFLRMFSDSPDLTPEPR